MVKNVKKYRKFMATAATISLVATATTATPVSAAYDDATGHYKEAVSYVTSEGIAKGYSHSVFGIHGELTRGDAAVMIANALGISVNNAPASSFTDLNTRVKDSVNALFAAGIIDGKSKTTFSPDDEITRAEMAKILANAYELDGSGIDHKFKDVNKNWAPYVNALLKNGITKGKTETEFGATQLVTRGEFAIFLYRLKDIQLEVDKEAPVLNYEGAITLNVAYNAAFTVPLVTAKDNKDPKVDVIITIKNPEGKEIDKIDTTKSGTYTITYSATDSAGNKAKDLVLKVIVAEQGYNPVPPSEDKNFTLSLMHTNDTHAHLDSVAKRITAIKEVRAEKPDALLLDAGDVFSGTLYFNEFKGQADVKFMNLAKYDVMTFGNHEFDLGSSPEGHKALADFIKAAEFPFVSANVDFSKDDLFTGLFETKISTSPDNSRIYSGIVKEVDGEKIGIFGLTTGDTKNIASPEKITFSDYIQEAETMVAEFEKMGIDKIVALTHIGYDNIASDNDLELARQVKGIDVIVGGHSHTKLAEPIIIDQDAKGQKKDPTVIVQAFQYSDFLGTLDVEFDENGKVVGSLGELIEIKDQVDDEEAEEVLKEYASKIEEVKTEPTGATAMRELENPRGAGNSVRSNETPLGNVITDGMLEKAKEYDDNVIMALQNGGGIRAGIDEGPITVGEVITVLPFGNTLATMKLSGEELKLAFETSLRSYPGENGGFLHVSGAKVEFDSTQPIGERIVSIKYAKPDGTYQEIKDDESYTIATNAFTAKGGDGYDVFKKVYEAGGVQDLGLSDWENLAEHLKSLGEVDPQIEGRIVDVATKLPDSEIEGKDFSGTAVRPKVYDGDITVDVTNSHLLEQAIVKGNLTFIGTPEEELEFSNIQVTGDLILTEVNGVILNFNGIEVEGETFM